MSASITESRLAEPAPARAGPAPVTRPRAGAGASSSTPLGFEAARLRAASVTSRLPNWQPSRAGFVLAAIVIGALLLAPIGSLVQLALSGSSELWPHLAAYVLPQALRDTGLLLLGVGATVLLTGTGAAWLVSAYDFPGRRVLDWALVLPLAVPTYIVAFAYLDLLHPVGPVQSGIRALLGFTSPRDLTWFPEIRSLPVCALLLGFVLYPYVYLPTRALFLMQGASELEVARTLGATPFRTFVRVALPLARPGIAIGISLALLETLNDVGAAEFLGVKTLTTSVYATWVNRSDLPGASQIALALLALVLACLAIEGWARRKARHSTGARQATRRPLAGARAVAAFLACALPVAIGFLVPAGHLAVEAAERAASAGLPPTLLTETLNTVLLSGAATLVTVALGVALASGARLFPSPGARALLRLAGFGYAIPGTILAVSLLPALASLDNFVASAAERVLSVSVGALAIGSGLALVYAYSVRFLAISLGSTQAGLAKMPPSLDAASRVLGAGPFATFRRVHVPLTVTAVASGALLVFVDCMKELPATLLLRPLNIETLATHLYGEAVRGTYEDGALAALIIIAVGLLPLALLSRLTAKA